jgi:galactokinase
LLVASHRSSQTLFENSTPELDLLVDTLISTPHVYGARLTGGGFGGAVMALTSLKFGDEEAGRVAGIYEETFGAVPDILHTQTANGAEVIATA